MVSKILISAGGTGGHIFPALAIADEFRKNGHQVLWIGATNGMEEQVVSANEFDIALLDVSGVRRMGFLRLLYMPIMLFKTVAKTIGIIKEFKPDITIGMGGYVSAPVGVASLLTGVPLYIHEQNSIPGLTNKLLSRFAQRTLTAFPSAFRGRKRVTLVGNPVRKEILFADYNARLVGSHGGPVKVLVLGGSRGATALNNKLPEVLSRVNEQLQITVWHQCGRGKSQSVQQIYNSRSVENNVVEFIEKIEEAYS